MTCMRTFLSRLPATVSVAVVMTALLAALVAALVAPATVRAHGDPDHGKEADITPRRRS